MSRLLYLMPMLLAATIVFPYQVRGQTQISESGDTRITLASQTGTVVATISVTALDGKCVDNCPSSRVSESYGAKKVVVVQALRISIGKKQVPVPLSVYTGLFSPREASLQSEKGQFLLRVEGGDGAESYFIRAYFDMAGVNRVVRYSSLVPNKPAEETVYYRNILKDE